MNKSFFKTINREKTSFVSVYSPNSNKEIAKKYSNLRNFFLQRNLTSNSNAKKICKSSEKN